MKTKIAILNNNPSERFAIEFYLARARVDGIFFDSENEMENWLQHCLCDDRRVIAAIVDCASLELSPHYLPCSGILASKEIPLIIAASSRDISDWCEVSNPWLAGMPVYLASLILLPQLLNHIRQTSDHRQGDDHFCPLSNFMQR